MYIVHCTYIPTYLGYKHLGINIVEEMLGEKTLHTFTSLSLRQICIWEHVLGTYIQLLHRPQPKVRNWDLRHKLGTPEYASHWPVKAESGYGLELTGDTNSPVHSTGLTETVTDWASLTVPPRCVIGWDCWHELWAWRAWLFHSIRALRVTRVIQL